MAANDTYRMLKRRLKRAGLTDVFSCHSIRAMTATNLLDQEVPIEDVRYLLGQKGTRPAAPYDRRKKRVTRNSVERISV